MTEKSRTKAQGLDLAVKRYKSPSLHKDFIQKEAKNEDPMRAARSKKF
jgi:hypothetical protein